MTGTKPDAGPAEARRLCFEDSLLVYGSGDRTDFVLAADGRRVTYVLDDVGRIVLDHLIDGPKTIAQLDAAARAAGGTTADVTDIVAELRDQALVRDETDPWDHEDPLDRQIRFLDHVDLGVGRGRGPELQHRLRQLDVTVVGAGGIGCWVALELAMAGVRTIRLVDDDVVDETNLSRQPLFDRADIGEPKVEAAARRLRAFGRAIDAVAIRRRVDDPAVVAALVGTSDAVVACADEPSTNEVSRWVSEACQQAGIPHVVGGGYSFHLALLGTMVVPGRTPCWSCIEAQLVEAWNGPGANLLRGLPSPRGSLVMSSALVGSMRAWDVVRVAIGAPPILAGRMGQLDLNTGQLDWRELHPGPECERCGGSHARC